MLLKYDFWICLVYQWPVMTATSKWKRCIMRWHRRVTRMVPDLAETIKSVFDMRKMRISPVRLQSLSPKWMSFQPGIPVSTVQRCQQSILECERLPIKHSSCLTAPMCGNRWWIGNNSSVKQIVTICGTPHFSNLSLQGLSRFGAIGFTTSASHHHTRWCP